MASLSRQIVQGRRDAVLSAIDVEPRGVSAIVTATGLTVYNVRYVLRTLQDRRRAYVESYRRVVCPDRVERVVAIYAAGDYDNADPPGELRLDFESTRHLQLAYSGPRDKVPPTEESSKESVIAAVVKDPSIWESRVPRNARGGFSLNEPSGGDE